MNSSHLSAQCWVGKQLFFFCFLPLVSYSASHFRTSIGPVAQAPAPPRILVLGSCCYQPGPLAQGHWICFHLLLAGFHSMKIPIPILTHQDPPPLWKTKSIPFHLPSPTVVSPLLLTQIWVWHPKLVRCFHPLYFDFVCLCLILAFHSLLFSVCFFLFLACKLSQQHGNRISHSVKSLKLYLHKPMIYFIVYGVVYVALHSAQIAPLANGHSVSKYKTVVRNCLLISSTSYCKLWS